MSGEPFVVRYSVVLQEQIADLQKRARTPNTAEAVVLHLLERACREHLADPGRVMGPADRCNRGSVFRLKSGRVRLFYIASSRLRRVTVLFIGQQRKEGDKRDPYAMLARLVKAGRFDADFAALEVTKPDL